MNQQIQAIDYEQLKKQETSKANKVYAFKQVSREDLFNNLQDLRHIVLLDLRPSQVFYSCHIRGSFCVDYADNNESSLLQYFDDVDKKATENETKYKSKPIRRAFLIDTNANQYNENNKETKLALDCIKKFGGFDKVSYLKQGIESFIEKYPFLCLNFHERDQESDEKAKKPVEENKVNSEGKPILSPYETKLLYSMSRFPTEITEGKIFLGSMYNANNRKQMQDLGIKSVIEFIDYKDQPIPEYKTTHFTYKNIPIDNETAPFVDFDEICTYIDDLLKDETKSPVLLCCKDGDTISPCFAIAYQMWHKGSNLTFASALVYQKRGTVDANKPLYTVLTTWQPQSADTRGRKMVGGLNK